MKYPIFFTCLLVWLFNLYSFSGHCQSRQDLVKHLILHNDSLFWKAYNNCDTDSQQQFFTEDIEFYHDKGGPLKGIENLMSTIKKNLCGDEKFRLRREAVTGTVKVFTLNKGDSVYGAIISGEHVFYILEPGKKERLDGLAKFTHLWVLQDNVWKMSRVLSYDHGPAPYINKRKEKAVAASVK
jgi:hypothetical protein